MSASAMKEIEDAILADSRKVLEAHPRMTVRRAIELDGEKSPVPGAVFAIVLAEREQWEARAWDERLRQLERDKRTLPEFLAAQEART